MTHCPKENNTRESNVEKCYGCKGRWIRGAHLVYIPGSFRFLSARSILSPIEVFQRVVSTTLLRGEETGKS
jgi:hypothetical protein